MRRSGARFVSSVGLAVATLALLMFAKSDDVRRLMGGGLSLQHQASALDCMVCHTPWRSVLDDKCLKCHQRLPAHAGAGEAAARQKAMAGVRCMDCHVEHKGPDIRVSFPGSAMCRTCHDFQAHPEIRKRPIMNEPEPNRVFPHSIHKERAPGMKLESCGDCHVDTGGNGALGYNVAQLNAATCRPCHYGSAELNEETVPVHYISNAAFSHTRHRSLDCMRCHGDILSVPELSGANLPSVEKCMECHDTQTGTTCIKCHRFHAAGTKANG